MKLAINRCYGGFNLSALATKRLAELQGRECYFFTNPTKPFDLHKEIPISVEQAEEAFMWFAYDTPKGCPTPANWHQLSMDERRKINDQNTEHSIEHGSGLKRCDPLLIQVVEELGDKANGKYAKLEIIEIPDGVEYEVDEYDGMESVHELHRSWS